MDDKNYTVEKRHLFRPIPTQKVKKNDSEECRIKAFSKTLQRLFLRNVNCTVKALNSRSERIQVRFKQKACSARKAPPVDGFPIWWDAIIGII